MQYRITRQSCGETVECVTRKQFNSARLNFAWLVRDMIEADTRPDKLTNAHCMSAASRISRDVHSATIALDEHASVTFERIGG